MHLSTVKERLVLIPLNPIATFDNYFNFYSWAIDKIYNKILSLSTDSVDAYVRYEPETLGVVDEILNQARHTGFTHVLGYCPIAYMDDFLIRHNSNKGVNEWVDIVNKEVVYLTFNEFLRCDGFVGGYNDEPMMNSTISIYFQDEQIIEELPLGVAEKHMTDECRTFIGLSNSGQIALYDTVVFDRSLCVGSRNVDDIIVAMKTYNLSICWETDWAVLVVRLRRWAIRLMNKYEVVYISADYVSAFYQLGVQSANGRLFKITSSNIIGMFIYYLLNTHVSVGVVALV